MKEIYTHWNSQLPFFEKLIDILKKEQYECVVWIGLHPGLSIFREVLSYYKLDIDYVVDSDSKKWGGVIPLYDKKIDIKIVRSWEVVKVQKDKAVYLAANSHGEELREMLKCSGVSEKRFFDLFELADFKKTIEKPLERMKAQIRQEPLGLRELQLQELEILKVFRDFCKDNHLKYFLAGGTLLGAVRHQGFIPWDDDVDVYMPYEDWTQFWKCFPKNEKYKILYWRLCDIFTPESVKLVDPATFIYSGGFPYISRYGVRITVFPIAGYPKEEDKFFEKWDRNDQLTRRWHLHYMLSDLGIKADDPRDLIEKEKYKDSFYDSEFVGAMWIGVQRPWAIRKCCFDKVVEMRFENEIFDIPIGYDEHLRFRYGAYMELPPVKDRVASHDMKAYMEEN